MKTSDDQGAEPQTTENFVDRMAGILATERGEAPTGETAPATKPDKEEEEDKKTPVKQEEPEEEEALDEEEEEESPADGPEDPDADDPVLDEEEEPKGGDQQPQYLFTIEEDGEEVGITAAEAKNGYLRRQDYTKKTTALAEARAAAEQEITQRYSKASELLDTAIFHAQAELAEFANIDFEAIKREDPYRAEQLQSRYFEAAQKYQAIDAKAAEVRQALQAQRVEAAKKFVQEQREILFTKIPELAVEKTAKDYAKAMREYANREGITDAEFGGIADNRYLVILDKARKYDALMVKKASAKVAKKKSSKTVSPGARHDSGKKSTRDRRNQAFKGAVKAGDRGAQDALAVDLFTNIFKAERSK